MSENDKNRDGIVQLSEIDAPTEEVVRNVQPFAINARMAVIDIEALSGHKISDEVKLEFEKIVESLPDKIIKADKDGNNRVSVEEMLPTIKEVLGKLEEARDSRAPLKGQSSGLEQDPPTIR